MREHGFAGLTSGFTYAANAEYRALMAHLIDEHGFTADEVSGKRMPELRHYDDLAHGRVSMAED